MRVRAIRKLKRKRSGIKWQKVPACEIGQLRLSQSRPKGAREGFEFAVSEGWGECRPKDD